MNLDDRVRDIVIHAATQSPFYRRLYASTGVDALSIRGIRDLANLPIVNPEDLIEHHLEFRSENCKLYRVSSSSGTVRHPKTLFRTVADSMTSAAVVRRLFEMAGLTDDDSLLIGQPFDLAHLGYLCLDACREMEVLAIPVGLSVTDERLLQLFQVHKPTAIFTSPSRMVRLTDLVRPSASRASFRLRHILLAGERTSDAQRKRITNSWGTIPHDLYGSEETDGLAGSCREHHGLHFMDDLFYLELVRPGTSEVIPQGKIGEAVVTSLYSKGTPLIRYRLGDLIERHTLSCPCGREWPLIAVLGRSDDVLFLYDGIKLHAFQVETMLHEIVPDASGFQLVCRTIRPGLEEIELIVLTDAGLSEGIVGEVERRLWKSSLDLDASAHMGSLRFSVSFDAQRLHVTERGKVPRVVDIRSLQAYDSSTR